MSRHVRSSGSSLQGVPRRDFLKYGLVGASLVVVGCRTESATGDQSSPTPEPTPDQRPGIEDENGNLRLLEWSGFEVPDLYPAYVEKFPDSEPRYTFIDNDADALGQLAAGTRADLLHPTVAYIPSFVDMGIMEPFDTSLISNFPDLNPALQTSGQVEDQQYMVVTDWGLSVPLFNADHVEPESMSYELLFDERYPGRISWHDTIQMIVIAGYVLGAADPWDMTDEELAEAQDYLTDKKGLVRTMWTGFGTDNDQDIAQGNIWITYAFNTTYLNALDNEINAVFVSEPEEGAIAWAEGFMLVADTQNYYHAHEYVDAWSSQEAGVWLIDNYGIGSANTTVVEADLDPSLVEAFKLDDPAALEEPRGHIQRFIPREAEYTRIWSEVKAS